MPTHHHASRASRVAQLALLAQAGAQINTPAQAQDLCTSRWFILARAYVKSLECPWYLLSAKHGLLSPERIVTPYDAELAKMPANKRRVWADSVAEHARVLLPYSDQILVLAGMRYREFLMPHLAQITESVYLPLDGLTVGMQCSWLRCNTRGSDGKMPSVP